MGQNLVDWWRALLDLIFPQCFCISCGKNTDINSSSLCSKCQKDLNQLLDNCVSCTLCATFIPRGNSYCSNCSDKSVHWFDLARAVFPYEGRVKEIVRRFKYNGMKGFAKPLGRLMREKVKSNLGLGFDIIIPVPLHDMRLKERGYNQAELLAEEISYGLGIPLVLNTLIRKVNTISQTGLSRVDRLHNLVDAFDLVQDKTVTGKSVLLVDDIFTTGATVAACCRILKEGGAKSVCVITFAAGKKQ